MTKERPDHHDAELILKVYEMRRESVMRESRDAMFAKFWPESAEACLELMKPEHPLSAAFRQTSSYWEMVYSFVRHGVVHPDLFMESNGEGLFLYAKVFPYLERLRKEVSPNVFMNAEWVVNNTETGRKRFAIIQARVEVLAKGKK